MKKLFHQHRPFPYPGHHSFALGHTSTSFAGAEFLHNQLKESIPVLSCAGYVAATVTGAIRVMKNRHWVKDIVAGAIIGIASAKLAALLVNKLTGKKQKAKEQPYFEPGTVEEVAETSASMPLSAAAISQ